MSNNKPLDRFKSAAATALTVGAIAATTTAFAHDDNRDRSNDIQEIHDVTGFDNIEIVGVYELDVKVGPEFYVHTSGAAKEVENLKVFVRGDTLVLDNEKRKKKMNKQHGVLVTITMPSLNGLDIVGVGTGDISGVKADDFTLNVSGVGEMDIAGTCGSLRAEVSGVGDFSTADLKCKDVKADLSGVGQFTVYASESADVSAMGIGEIVVLGNPKSIEKNSNFMSKIRIK
ncbi:head GIN domain-containing protein [Fretibacter rubidus]|uniref:head GIN domain-containing protein n=1 Tax=Fretibacter rubidus TaxID=570162 RepID=UPI00352AE508